LTCAGYPEPRLFIEAQGWWLPMPGQSGENFGHIHNGMCAPYGQTLRGVVHLDIRVIMHNTPATLSHLRVTGRFRKDDGEHEYLDLASVDLNDAVCPVMRDCETWVPIDFDTAKMPYDGIQSIKIEVKSNNPNSRWLNTVMYWRAYLKNGKPVRHDNSANDYAIWASALAENFVYIRAGINRTWPNPVTGPLDFDDVWHVADRYRDPVDPSEVRHDVILDANFHAGIPGTTIRSGRNELNEPLSVDTQALTNGAHRLILRTFGDEAASRSTVVSVLVIPFTVQHPGAPSTLTPIASRTATATAMPGPMAGPVGGIAK